MATQQMLLGGGKPPTKYYIDDVFSMDPYYGKTAYPYNVLGHTITTGVNIKDDGGLVWIKTRESTFENLWFSPLMGVGKNITPASAAAMVTQGQRITQYKTDGFKLGSDQSVNHTDNKVMSWSFKNSKGFFSHVEWTGNGTARTISHDLGCKPGFIAVKSMSQGGNWTVWHRGMNKGVTPHNYYQRLNVGGGLQTDYEPFTAEPTATGFAIIADNSNSYEAYMNKSGETYKAWVWAGGASDEATANSVDFSGATSAKLSMSSSSDLAFGTGDFTMECWVKPTSLSSTLETVFDSGNTGSNNYDSIYFGFSQSQVHVGSYNSYYNQASTTNHNGQWMHIAVSRSGTKLRIFKNGTLLKTETNSTDLKSGGPINLGIQPLASQPLHGSISNFRAVKGQALYTSSFRPSTEPLTTTSQGATASNVKLLCCQSSTVTTAAVAPGTITNTSTTANSDSPFDDAGNFIFGDSGKQNIIKTGYYIGNGDGTNGLEVELGFEPQFVWIKADGTTSDANYNWLVFDTMRGMDNEKMDNTNDSGRLYSSNNGAEVTTDDGINVSPTGFKIQGNNDDRNGDGHQYIYIAIRASEGYVSKVPEAGSDVFAMDTGNGSTTIPAFDSGFPVDMNMNRKPASTWSWQLGTRLQGKDQLNPNTSDAEGGALDKYVWDSNAGFGADSYYDSSYQSWMWKRHAGFDVVTYVGGGASSAPRSFPHSLGKAPEMIWTKNRDSSTDWVVWHKGLNGGGNNAVSYNLRLNESQAQGSNSDIYGGANSVLPTSTHWTTGGNNMINENGSDFIALLFASVDGISSVGSYSGSSGDVSVTTGFQPRLVILKRFTGAAGTGDWYVYDTTRGFTGSGNDDKALKLNSSAAQTTMTTGTVTSTGFTITMQGSSHNSSGSTYIYYAHA